MRVDMVTGADSDRSRSWSAALAERQEQVQHPARSSAGPTSGQGIQRASAASSSAGTPTRLVGTRLAMAAYEISPLADELVTPECDGLRVWAQRGRAVD